MPRHPNPTSTSGTPSPRPVDYTYWLTRDRAPDTGELSRSVRVWLAAPSRSPIARGAVWMAPAFDGHLWGEWSIEMCLWNARVYPDDDRMCIRVEGDKIWEPTDSLNLS